MVLGMNTTCDLPRGFCVEAILAPRLQPCFSAVAGSRSPYDTEKKGVAVETNPPNKALQENTATIRELSQLVFHWVELLLGYVPAVSLNLALSINETSIQGKALDCTRI